MTIGEKIKRLRTEAGMTQEELGKAIGVQKAAINKYETGRVANMKRSTIAELAKTFGVNPVWLMADDRDWPPADDRFSDHPSDYTDSKDQERLEALHQNPRLGLLFDHSTKMKPEDVDFMISMAERIIRERDADE